MTYFVKKMYLVAKKVTVTHQLCVQWQCKWMNRYFLRVETLTIHTRLTVKWSEVKLNTQCLKGWGIPVIDRCDFWIKIIPEQYSLPWDLKIFKIRLPTTKKYLHFSALVMWFSIGKRIPKSVQQIQRLPYTTTQTLPLYNISNNDGWCLKITRNKNLWINSSSNKLLEPLRKSWY